MCIWPSNAGVVLNAMFGDVVRGVIRCATWVVIIGNRVISCDPLECSFCIEVFYLLLRGGDVCGGVSDVGCKEHFVWDILFGEVSVIWYFFVIFKFRWLKWGVGLVSSVIF